MARTKTQKSDLRSMGSQSMPSVAVAPRETDIQARAFLLFQERVRKGLPGDAQSDWLEAERQLRKE